MWTAIKGKLQRTYLHPRHLALREIEKFIRREGIRLTGRLLDIGCGKKPYVDLLPNVRQYVGVDVPSTMHGIQRVDVLASVMALPFPEHAFDSLLCTEILEHTPSPVDGLAEMARVAKPGACLLLTVPLSEQLHERPHDYCRFTSYWLRHLLDATGWELISLVPRGGPWLEIGYRFSSFLYTSLGSTSKNDGNLVPRPIAGPFVVVTCAGIQALSSLLNRLWPSDLSTIGYSAVARKQ